MKAYDIWRRAVLGRDKQCEICGRGDSLFAHHIKSKEEYPEQRYDVGNGMAVCPSCHARIHERGKYQMPQPYTYPKVIFTKGRFEWRKAKKVSS